MTAEIAIMNKTAVALAADSAVTIGHQDKKIYNSANKLFTLSKYHPVGAMIYGSATFMSIPWETIIKIYRSKLGKQKFNTLKEYTDNFIDFLDNGNPLFPDPEQEKYLSGTISGYFYHIKNEIFKEVRSTIDNEGKVEYSQIERITSDDIERHYDLWNTSDLLPSIPKTHIKDIIKKYASSIDKAKNEMFGELPISEKSSEQLNEISASIFSKNCFPPSLSGVVIAGFGEKDVFPCLKSFSLDGIVNDRLRYIEDSVIDIRSDNRVSISAFAQNEMVMAFMNGIDPSYSECSENYLDGIFDKYPEVIVKRIPNLSESERKDIRENLKRESNGLFKDYCEWGDKYRRQNHVNPIIDMVAVLPKYELDHVNPIIDMVAVLPKDELAAMAESFVHLTSFKRKITMGVETVGGPIDVAVISKGDGFVWIKRKHYFKPELNPHFFSNYYRDDDDEKE
jgi:hypothetical protein